MSLKDSLLHLLHSRGQVTYGEVCQFTVEEGYKVETASRRLRELVNEHPIEVITKKSKRGTNYIAGWRIKIDIPAHIPLDVFMKVSILSPVQLPDPFPKKENRSLEEIYENSGLPIMGYRDPRLKGKQDKLFPFF